MFCRKCGREIEDNALVCGYCGAPVNDANSGQESRNRGGVYGEPDPSYSGQSQNPSGQTYSTTSGMSGNPYQNTGYGTPQNMDGGATGLGITSMVLGIVSLLISCCVPKIWLTLIVAALSIVFGILSIQKNTSGKGMAIAGIVCSIIAIVMGALVMLAGAVLFGSIMQFFKAF